jgi:hypothetical protein
MIMFVRLILLLKMEQHVKVMMNQSKPVEVVEYYMTLLIL